MSVKNGVGAAALMQPGLVSTTTQLYLCLYLYFNFLFTVFYLLAFLFVFGTFGRSNAARSGEHHHATVRLYFYRTQVSLGSDLWDYVSDYKTILQT